MAAEPMPKTSGSATLLSNVRERESTHEANLGFIALSQFRMLLEMREVIRVASLIVSVLARRVLVSIEGIGKFHQVGRKDAVSRLSKRCASGSQPKEQ